MLCFLIFLFLGLKRNSNFSRHPERGFCDDLCEICWVRVCHARHEGRSMVVATIEYYQQHCEIKDYIFSLILMVL